MRLEADDLAGDAPDLAVEETLRWLRNQTYVKSSSLRALAHLLDVESRAARGVPFLECDTTERDTVLLRLVIRADRTARRSAGVHQR